MSKVIVDQQARNKIKDELTTNFLIEAGAGSGKTTSLVARMVNLIYTGTCDVSKMVAITFTRKAADELKVRFQSDLEKKWKEENNPTASLRLSNALQNIEQCYIGTVHAFCAKLLRERPIEAKLDLSFQELEEADDNDLLEEAWHRYLFHLQEQAPESLNEINELGVSINDLFDWLKGMKNYPDVEWVATPSDKPELQSTYQSFSKIIKEAKRALPENEPKNKYDKLQKAIITALMKMRHMDESQDKDIIEIFELFDKNVKPTQNRWGSKEDALYYYEKISGFFEQSVQGLLHAWRSYCHPKIIAFLSEAMHDYEQLKKERSLLNYQDLLLKTNALLKGNPEVRRYFQGKYQCLLVDEFQDTDPIQAEIMFFLTSEDDSEKVWTECKPKPGSLFVVGDPKQAIYRFRRADIDTYNRVKQLIEEHGGEVLQLTMNFRTINTITEKLNTVFQEDLPEQETIYQAAYRPLQAFHDDIDNLLSGIKQLPVSDDYSKKDDVLMQDAENIANYISDQIKLGMKAKDYMVLTRYNEGVATYAQKIEQYGIPVSVSGEIVIGEMIEFRDLVTLLQTFVDPTDSLSFVAALRGVFFGISDDDLFQWKQAGGRFSIYSHVPDALAEQTKNKMEIALAKMTTYQKWIRNFSPTTAIEKIIEDVGFYLVIIQASQGKRAYKALLQIIEAIRKLESTGHTDYKSVVDRFTEMVTKKTVVANLEEDADAVRVMNIHKAKGLEAPVVFLAHPAKKSKLRASRHIKREDDQSKGYFLFAKGQGNYQKEIAMPVNWDMMKEEELRYLAEEEVRIVYVAATRAEKELIISSSVNKNNPWNRLLEIDGIKQIELLEEQPDESLQTTNVITLDEYQEKNVNRLDWLENAKQLTFNKWSPTDDKDFTEIANLERDAGGGQAWGTVVHDVLEKVVEGVDISNFVKHALAKNNLPQEREAEVLEFIQLFKESEIWKELQSADQVLTEVPFQLKVEHGSPLYTLLGRENDDRTPVNVKGVIDLIYLSNGEWTIVDYKTDRVKSEEDLQKLRHFYGSQINFYKQAWEHMTGDTVKESKLFFFSELEISL